MRPVSGRVARLQALCMLRWPRINLRHCRHDAPFTVGHPSPWPSRVFSPLPSPRPPLSASVEIADAPITPAAPRPPYSLPQLHTHTPPHPTSPACCTSSPFRPMQGQQQTSCLEHVLPALALLQRATHTHTLLTHAHLISSVSFVSKRRPKKPCSSMLG